MNWIMRVTVVLVGVAMGGLVYGFGNDVVINGDRAAIGRPPRADVLEHRRFVIVGRRQLELVKDFNIILGPLPMGGVTGGVHHGIHLMRDIFHQFPGVR